MNEQQTLDKAGTPRRLTIMNNEAQQSIYGLLVHSEEKGRGIMETAVYATCILSVVAAILQFISQPTPDPFAGFDSSAQPTPVVSHQTVEATFDTKS
jgi:putative exporter of polyketide antibiotics